MFSCNHSVCTEGRRLKEDATMKRGWRWGDGDLSWSVSADVS